MKKILIVEDDSKIAMSLAIRLKAAGYEVIVAYDGLHGVSQAVKNKPDLMLLDITMPAGGGLRVCERVQSIPDTVGIPTIFMTASKKPMYREAAKDLGAIGFFEKPFDTSELLDCIQDQIGAMSGSSAPTPSPYAP